MHPYDLIAKKRDGGEQSAEELSALVRSIVDGSMPDYQTAAWLMAAYLRGLTPAETLALTLAMRDSGETVDWGEPQAIKLDKHSSGGVGDKTTLVVVPLLASCGVPILKMSGRGLGHTGGTIDKLESIPGFRTDLSIEEAREQVARLGAALIGQSPSLVPADKKLYALRDVTATIASIPLIAASIMSKKLAGGASAVLLDVKVGRGAFMKTTARARELAETMVAIGRSTGVRTVAMLTAMDEPLGHTIGNLLEVDEACAVLTGTHGVDVRFRDLCLALAARGLVMADKATNEQRARQILESKLQSGDAARKLAEIIEAQGGDPEIVWQTGGLTEPGAVVPVRADIDGYVAGIDAEAVGILAMRMGAGREKKEDAIDPNVGIMLMKKIGDAVKAGDTLAWLHLRSESEASDAVAALRSAYAFSDTRVEPGPLIIGVVE